jgi:RNA polymerase sigma factor (sigma-70 family)
MAPAKTKAVLRYVRTLAACRPDSQQTDGELVRAFLAGDDQPAFEAIVRRHGSLVLRVCRRVLGNAADAEDAFQATFMFLAQRAGSIRKKDSLASWLHGVAHRMATNARRAASRRRRHERQAGPVPPPNPAWQAAWREVQSVLDEELQALPESYREPLIRCCLEQKCCDEVARELGLEEPAVRQRLSRGRKLLERRLARRGVSLAAVLTAIAGSGPYAAAGPGAALLASTVTLAAHVAFGKAPAGSLASAKVVALVEGASKAMFLAKLKAVVLFLVAIGLAGAGVRALLAQSQVSAPPPAGAKGMGAGMAPPGRKGASRNDPRAKPEAHERDTVEVTGRVLDPDGRPVAGANISVWTYGAKKKQDTPRITSGRDGKFHLNVTRAAMKQQPQVTAWAGGYALDWAPLDDSGKVTDLTLRLAKDDAPIEGRILDLQGKPVAGARVRLVRLSRTEGSNLDEWVKSIGRSAQDAVTSEYTYFRRHIGEPGQPPPGLPAEVTTDAEGRFKLQGAGRERLVVMRVQKAGIATADIEAVTRRMPTTRTPQDPYKRYSPRTYHGAAFDFAAAPSRPFEGVVTDKATGKPVADVVIQGNTGNWAVRATTDAQGRYRLEGLPLGEQELVAVPPATSPCFIRSRKAGRSADQKPATANFELYSGVWITGTITDSRSGKPVEAEVHYRHDDGNVAKDKIPGYIPRGLAGGYSPARSGPDGKFKVLGSPGKGYLLVRADTRRYVAADFTDWQGDVARPAPRQFIPSSPVETALNYNAVCHVTIGDKTPDQYAITVEPGVTARGLVLAPGGQPLTGASLVNPRSGRLEDPESLPTAEFTLPRFNPKWPRPSLIVHPTKKLGLLFQPRRGDEGPFRLQLQRTATVSGRIVDADGQPVANARLELAMTIGGASGGDSPFHRELRTDGQGKFTAGNLVEGVNYHLSWPTGTGVAYRDLTVKAGETKGLGDVRDRSK